jgi:hypothetical protein
MYTLAPKKAVIKENPKEPKHVAYITRSGQPDNNADYHFHTILPLQDMPEGQRFNHYEIDSSVHKDDKLFKLWLQNIVSPCLTIAGHSSRTITANDIKEAREAVTGLDVNNQLDRIVVDNLLQQSSHVNRSMMALEDDLRCKKEMKVPRKSGYWSYDELKNMAVRMFGSNPTRLEMRMAEMEMRIQNSHLPISNLDFRIHQRDVATARRIRRERKLGEKRLLEKVEPLVKIHIEDNIDRLELPSWDEATKEITKTTEKAVAKAVGISYEDIEKQQIARALDHMSR